ncbi:hypothetical protein [Microcella sp.]|uniref:hypothetical protein n=1 Tax=Microcella sp. TaxID=1913979 RepID=UPI00391BB0D9
MTQRNLATKASRPVEAVIYASGALEAQALAIALEAVAKDLEAAGIPALHTRDFATNRRQLETTMRAAEATALAEGGE